MNDGFELRGLATVKDIVKNTEHPMASKDAQGQLRVGAAVGVGAGTEERVEKLVAAGADVLIDLLNTIDAALSTDEGTAVRRHLSAGRPVYFREPLTPAGHVIRKNPDGSCQLVRFTAGGSELVVSEPAAA